MTNLNIVITMSHLGTGGAERVAVNYANWLVENTNSNITFIIFNDEKTLYSLDKKVKVIVLSKESKKQNSNKISKILERIKLYRKKLYEINPNIVFTMFSKIALYTMICKPKNTLLISSERCNINKVSTLGKYISRYVAHNCDGFVFQTKRMMDLYPKKIRKKSIVIPNSVFIKNDIDYDIETKKIIVAMGRLTYQKGFDTLIKTFSIFSKSYQEHMLYIIGDGEDKEKLHDLIKELNLSEKVVLLGNQKNVEKYLMQSEMFILSSRYEGMPNALMEAMACGLPCISTDCEAGPSELIDNYVNGILVEVDNVEELLSKMNELAENQKLRKKLGTNAKKILDTNSPDKIFSSYYDYMKKIYFKHK